MKFFQFIFADGYMVLAAAMSATEKKAIEKVHGKLISKNKI